MISIWIVSVCVCRLPVQVLQVESPPPGPLSSTRPAEEGKTDKHQTPCCFIRSPPEPWMHLLSCTWTPPPLITWQRQCLSPVGWRLSLLQTWLFWRGAFPSPESSVLVWAAGPEGGNIQRGERGAHLDRVTGEHLLQAQEGHSLQVEQVLLGIMGIARWLCLNLQKRRKNIKHFQAIWIPGDLTWDSAGWRRVSSPSGCRLASDVSSTGVNLGSSSMASTGWM